MSLETVLKDFEDLEDDTGAIGVMGEEGDTKHVWKPQSPKEVAEARLLFRRPGTQW